MRNSNPIHINEKLKIFSEVRVKHPMVERVLDELSLFTTPHSGVDIILLIGATGVGKTTLGRALREMTYRDSHDLMMAEPDVVPAVFIEAKSLGGSYKVFEWKSLYKSILDELHEPLINRKRATSITIIDDVPKVEVSRIGSITALREALERSIDKRKCQYIWIDEAIHILQHSNKEEILANMNTLKSIAINCDAKIILVGSYDLFRVLQLNGQLARRCHPIHFARYKESNSTHVKAFKTTARTLANEMKLDTKVIIDSNVETLMSSCVGCVGTMKDVLQRAYTLACKRGNKWHEKYIYKCLYTKHVTDAILSEVIEGERAMVKAIKWSC